MYVDILKNKSRNYVKTLYVLILIRYNIIRKLRGGQK